MPSHFVFHDGDDFSCILSGNGSDFGICHSFVILPPVISLYLLQLGQADHLPLLKPVLSSTVLPHHPCLHADPHLVLTAPTCLPSHLPLSLLAFVLDFTPVVPPTRMAFPSFWDLPESGMSLQLGPTRALMELSSY